MNFKNRTGNIFTVSFITISLLFTVISCNNVKREPVQVRQVPVLPSKPVQPEEKTTEPVQFTDNKTDEQTSAGQKSAEVMLNPPHGQPFHRCDIPVGAPLNSQPAGQQPANNTQQAASTQAQPAVTQPSASAPNPANNPFAPTIENASRLNPSQARNTTTANNGVKPRLNPAHGQPFHRCDIPVGSPLPN